MENISSKKDCVLFQVTGFISKKWSLLIILELSKGNKLKRYSELKRALSGITPKMLSARLKELKKEGLIEKKITTTSVPFKTEYFLTESGKDFLVVLEQIKKWGIKNKSPSSNCKLRKCKFCTN